MIKIDYNKCCWKDGKCASGCCGDKTCNGCAEICPVNAITREDIVKLDKSICIDCGACISACPHGALSFE